LERPLRVAVLSYAGLSHSRAYIEFLRSRGHEVSWIVYDRPVPDLGIPTYDISHGASGRETLSKWKYLLAGISIRKVLRVIRPDILHGHHVTSAGVICLLSGFRPYVLTAHGSDLMRPARSPLWRPILRRALGQAALVNTVSDELAGLAAGLGVPDDRLLVA